MSYEELAREIVNALAPANGEEFTQSALSDIDYGEPEVAIEMSLGEAETPKSI